MDHAIINMAERSQTTNELDRRTTRWRLINEADKLIKGGIHGIETDQRRTDSEVAEAYANIKAQPVKNSGGSGQLLNK